MKLSAQNERQFAVIGLGRFGRNIAKALYEMGYDVLAIDKDMERVQEFSHEVTHVVQADSTDEDALRSLGILNFDVVIVAIGKDTEATIMTTLQLKEIGVPYIVAIARTVLQIKVLEKIGAKGAVGRTGHVRRKPAGALSGRRGHYFKGHCGPDCAQGSFSLLFWLCPKGVWRDGAFVPAGRRDACERVSGTVRRTGL